MAERTYKERRLLGRILLGISAFAGVMAIVYVIKLLFFVSNVTPGFTTAMVFAVVMIFGALMAIGMNYTIRVPRGKDDDRSQILAAVLMMFLGVIICVTTQILLGIGEFVILPIVFYCQNWLMFLVAMYSLKFYTKK